MAIPPNALLRSLAASIYIAAMKEKWSEIKANLRNMLESGIFRVWVEPLEAVIEPGGIKILAPNAFMAEWLKRHLFNELKSAAARVLASDAISFEIVENAENRERAPRPVASREIVASVLPQKELPVRLAPARALPEWNYKFDDFVTGPSNSMAVAAARDMCGGGQVRTLFVTSGPGLGKTHLAQAAGQAISTGPQPLKIAYLTAERFASRFVAAMRAKELEDFKQYLCGLDALLLEDIHFLQRKKTMQEMILTVIKNIQAKGGRVIFTSSFSPRQLKDMDSQLVSMLCSGILTNMERPDLSMRQEILRRKAKSWQVILPEEVCGLVSEKLCADVRQLESCLKSMIFKAKILNSGLTLDLALDTLRQYAGVENAADMDGIVRLVCESFGLTKLQLCSKSRKREYVRGRNTIFYLARKHTDLSLEEIGCIFNRRHSTVQRGIIQLEEELASESRAGRQIARAVSLIERKCGLTEDMPRGNQLDI